MAVVAAEDAVADRFAQLDWNRIARFDREVRDAASRIELIWRDDRLGRAHLDAAGTGPAVFANRRVHRQRQVRVNLTEEEIRSRVATQQQCVLADPTQPRVARERLFQHRRRVGEGAVRKVAGDRRDASGQSLQARANQLVVVAAECVARHVSEAWVRDHVPCVADIRRRVVEPYGDHSYRTGLEFRRSAAPGAVPLHVFHVAVMARAQPVEQMRLVLGELDAGDAGSAETQLRAPALDVGGKHIEVDRVEVDCTGVDRTGAGRSLRLCAVADRVVISTGHSDWHEEWGEKGAHHVIEPQQPAHKWPHAAFRDGETSSSAVSTRVYNCTMADPDTNLHPNALYTAQQVRAIDRAAIDGCAIPGFTLMQRAANAAFANLRRHWPAARHLLVLAGRGNNGGDAFLVAEQALKVGLAVEVLVLAGESSGDAAKARDRFVAAGGTIRVADVETRIAPFDVVVDGLFGTGLTRPLDGVAAVLVDALNATHLPVLALDLPSGLNADTGMLSGPCVRAHATTTFVAWKRGLFTGDAFDVCGETELATLGIPEAALDGIDIDARLIELDIDRLLAPRRNNANKGNFGHVLAIGGDHGMGGAIRLTGEAALRCGAGLVSVATRSAHVTAILAARPELMVRGIDGPQALTPMLEGATTIALGPGLGQDQWGRALWHCALDAGRATVVDADALNLLAAAPRPLPDCTVLTPHPGEASRLLNCDAAAVQRDRFAAVRELALHYSSVVVLKGAGSLIAHPDGRVAVCRWGNPGMASPGMGDVLTGVIAALLAQGLDAWDAARLGVAAHARAGDAAAGVVPRGLIASDLLDMLRLMLNAADGPCSRDP